MPRDMEEHGKKRYFESLYDLDEEDESGARDDGRLESIAFFKRTKSTLARPHTAPDLARTTGEPSKPETNPAAAAPESQGLRRTLSSPPQTANHGATTAAPAQPKPALRKPTTKPSTAPRPKPKNTKSKRKPTEDVKLAPESRRIFKGLAFFFFPNNDINVHRRLRIQKAIEYGAAWCKEWSTEVSHVIVDRSVDFKYLLDHLKVQSLPDTVVAVNEVYPADCLDYRCLLDPKQKCYRVLGMPETSNPPSVDAVISASEVQQSSADTHSSSHSLQLKPPTKAVLAREPHTPSRASDESFRQDDVGQARSDVKGTIPLAGQSLYDDALLDFMTKAKTMRHVPLDSDEEEETASLASQGNDSDTEDSDNGSPSTKPQTKPKSVFRCMDKHDGVDEENPNARTIELLQELASCYEGMKDEWRARACRNGIATLRRQKRWITTAAEAILLPGIGPRLAEKIEEIANTNELRRLDALTSDPRTIALRQFTGIYGVGAAQASKWVEQGFRTLDDLRNGAKLTRNQEVGLDHYHDFLERIPRDEVRQLGAIVDTALRQLDPDFEVTIGGSYRRGSADSGDIDLLITKPDAPASVLQTVVLKQLVPNLFETGFLKCALAASSKEDGSKWNGACALPGEGKPWRRIDLLLVPWEELGAALIYFTGNDFFNRSIRLLASTKGMRLNQHGLFKDVMRGKGRQKITDGTLLEGKDERKIFEILGVAWRPPEHRIC